MSTVFAVATTFELYLILNLGGVAFEAIRRGDSRSALVAGAALLPGLGGLLVISQMMAAA